VRRFKDNPINQPVINADNYRIYAQELFWTELCNKKFGDATDNRPYPDYPPTKTPSTKNTKAINIILRYYNEMSYYENQWFFYETPVGTSAVCRPAANTLAKFPLPNGFAASDPKWPNGEFPVKPYGMDCTYKNNNENAGALWCKGRNGPIQCKAETNKDPKKCMEHVYQRPYVFCEWS